MRSLTDKKPKGKVEDKTVHQQSLLADI